MTPLLPTRRMLLLAMAASLAGGRARAAAEDDSIVFAGMFGGLMRVRAARGPIEPLTQLDPPEITHRWPQFLPGGRAVLFSSHSAPSWCSRARVDVVSLADGGRS